MYRVFLLIAFLTYGSSAPYGGVTVEKSFPMQQEPLLGQQQFIGQQQLTNTGFQQNDDSDVVDNTGSGYAFFKKQKIESRPFVQVPILRPDLSEYAQSSAFIQQPFVTQPFPSNKDLSTAGGYGQVEQKVLPRQDFSGYGRIEQKVLPRQEFSGYGEVEQRVLPRQEFSSYGQIEQKVLPRQDFNGYGRIEQKVLPRQFSGYGQVEQQDLPRQLSGYGQGQQQDLRSNLLPQQILLPQADLNWQQKALGGYGSQLQELSFVQRPKQIFGTEQKALNFGSSYGGQGQQPLSSGFVVQSNQQNDMEQPLSNGVFISSQGPSQRFISQSQQGYGGGY